jgi:hypothetical protein
MLYSVKLAGKASQKLQNNISIYSLFLVYLNMFYPLYKLISMEWERAMIAQSV